MTGARAGAQRLTPSIPAGFPRSSDAHTGCSRTRLFLLPALALLLGALSLFHTAPAQAQDVWSATLTVKSVSGGKGCFSTTGPGACNVAISPQGFTHSNVAYKATQLATYTVSDTNYLYLTLDKAIPMAVKMMTLCVGSTAFQLNNAAVSEQTIAGDTVHWTGTSVPVWTVSQQVAVKLVTGSECSAPPAAPTSLSVTAGDGSLTLSWTAPTGTLTGYDVHYTSAVVGTVGNDVAASGSDPSAAWVALTRSGTTASQTISSLSNGTLYRVRVRAKTSSANSAWVHGTGTPMAPASTDADLSGLTATSSTSASGTFSALTLSPSTFAATTTAYTASVANTITHVKLAPTVSDSNATVEVGKGSSLTAVTSGSASGAIALSVGENAITVKVTAQDTSTTKTYTVTVTRAAAQQSTTSTVSLSASPNPVTEGQSVTVTATLGSAATGDVVVPVTLTAGTAETGDYGTLTSITVSAGQTTATGTITTTADTDTDNETFTVALGTLPTGYAEGAVTSVTVTIEELSEPSELTLEIKYGNQTLLIGPYGKLGEADGFPRWVQASPTMKRLSLKLSWPEDAITGAPTAEVYYYMPGEAGDTLTWGTGQNGTTKTLEMYSNLGTPGYPRVTLRAGEGVEYTIIFQNNGRWEFHHNNLLGRLQMKIPQGP